MLAHISKLGKYAMVRSINRNNIEDPNKIYCDRIRKIPHRRDKSI